MKHTEFLTQVRHYVKNHPDVAPYISDHVAAGIQDKLDQMQQTQIAAELALSVSLTRRYKHADDIILQKLEAMHGKSFVDWTNTIQTLRAKQAKPNAS